MIISNSTLSTLNTIQKKPRVHTRKPLQKSHEIQNGAVSKQPNSLNNTISEPFKRVVAPLENPPHPFVGGRLARLAVLGLLSSTISQAFGQSSPPVEYANGLTLDRAFPVGNKLDFPFLSVLNDSSILHYGFNRNFIRDYATNDDIPREIFKTSLDISISRFDPSGKLISHFNETLPRIVDDYPGYDYFSSLLLSQKSIILSYREPVLPNENIKFQQSYRHFRETEETWKQHCNVSIDLGATSVGEDFPIALGIKLLEVDSGFLAIYSKTNPEINNDVLAQKFDLNCSAVGEPFHIMSHRCGGIRDSNVFQFSDTYMKALIRCDWEAPYIPSGNDVRGRTFLSPSFLKNGSMIGETSLYMHNALAKSESYQFPVDTITSLSHDGSNERTICATLKYHSSQKDTQETPCIFYSNSSYFYSLTIISFDKILQLTQSVGLVNGGITRSKQTSKSLIASLIDSSGNRLGNPFIGFTSLYYGATPQVVQNKWLYAIDQYHIYEGPVNLYLYNITNFPGYFTDILGNASVGHILNAGQIINDPDGEPKQIAIQWERVNYTDNVISSFFQKGVPIPKATQESYTVTRNDIGWRLQAVATYQDPTDTWHRLISYPTTSVLGSKTDPGNPEDPIDPTNPDTASHSKTSIPLIEIIAGIGGGLFSLMLLGLLIRHCLKNQQHYTLVLPKPNLRRNRSEHVRHSQYELANRPSRDIELGREPVADIQPSAPPITFLLENGGFERERQAEIRTDILSSAPPQSLLTEDCLESKPAKRRKDTEVKPLPLSLKKVDQPVVVTPPIKSDAVVIPKEFECAISQEIMAWPTLAVAVDGHDSHSYDKDSINRAFRIKRTDPQSGHAITTLTPNIALRHAIESWWCGVTSEQLRNQPLLRTDLESWINRRGREHLTGELQVILDRFIESGQA